LKIFQVTKPSTSLKINLGTNYPLDNEVLFGEKIKVIDENKNYYFCETLLDGYKGWISKKDLSLNIKEPTHRILNLRTHVYKNPHEKSLVFFYLPLGSKSQLLIMTLNGLRYFLNIKIEVLQVMCHSNI
jgi:hypothetical protein